MSSQHLYPRINQTQVDRLYRSLQAPNELSETVSPELLPCGTFFDLTGLRDVIAKMLLDPEASLEVWEDRYSHQFYCALRSVDDIVMADFGFWRYLTLVEMRDVLRRRESGLSVIACGLGPRNKREMTLALRMYLRGRIYDLDPTFEGRLISNVGETESSHLFTGTTGRQHVYSAALRAHIAEKRLTQTQGRELVKRLNETKATVLVEYLDLDENRLFIRTIHDTITD